MIQPQPGNPSTVTPAPEKDVHLHTFSPGDVASPGGKRVVAVMILKALSVFLCLVGVYILNALGEKENLYRLVKLKITGTRFLDEQSLKDMIQKDFSTNLSNLDLDRLQQRIEKIGWVGQTTIRRILPDTLTVEIRERIPAGAARLDRLTLFDSQGVLLDEYRPAVHGAGFPVVSGLTRGKDGRLAPDSAGSLKSFMAFREDVLASRPELMDSVSEVDVSDPEDVVVLPVDGAPRVHLGQARYGERLARFYQTYPQIREKNGLMCEVDMRFEGKIILTPLG